MKNKPTTTGEQAYLLSISNLMQKKKKKVLQMILSA